MESKIIYAKTKDAFQRELPNIPDNLNPLVFIEDTREVWIMGHYFSIGSPGIHVSESNNIITVEVGPSNFTLSSSGDNIVIRKGDGNNIIFSSPALTSINTEYPLNWNTVTKKLIHEKTDIVSGSYGETSSAENVSLLTIPWFTVDSWGHLTSAAERNIKIRDYVEQISSSVISGNYNLLIGYSENSSSETNPVRKAIGLTYNPTTKGINVEGGINIGGDSSVSGNLVVTNGQIIGDVQGNVTGTATPKIHLSTEPEYGGASTELYGHVKLQDELITEPEPSSNNSDINASNVIRGIAATPKMVWDVKQELLGGIDATVKITAINVNNDTIEFEDFPSTLSIKTSKGLKGGINPLTKEITLSSIEIKGYNENKNLITIEDNLEFTDDFEISQQKVSLRWDEHNE